jgi:hypothetical protein
MSTTDDTSEPGWIETAESTTPTYELTFAYDDPSDPSTVTVYPEDDPDRTTWLSVDVDHAVSVEDVR